MILTGNLSLEIRNKIRDNGRVSCKSGHTEYQEMAFRLDGGICFDNTITRKMSSSIEIVDNPKGKAVAWNYYGFFKSDGKFDKGKVDKAKIACKLCRIILKYSGITSNLTDHIRRKK